MHKHFGEDRACSSGDMRADIQTITQTCWSQQSAPLPGRINFTMLHCQGVVERQSYAETDGRY